MRKKFTWLLSLLVTFGFLGIFSHGYAQEAQETVELYAEQASACYNESNEYVVSISVKDFIQLTKFDLQLNYPAATFNYLGATGVSTALSTMTFQQLVDGQITMQWTGSPVTIGDNLKTEILKLRFSLDNYPNLTAASFSGNLTWAKKDFWYTIPGPTYDAVNTVVSTNGSLTITQAYTTIQSQIEPEDCAGEDAVVVVTSPANLYYSFNGLPFVSGENANKIQATPGSTVTVRVKDANGCISHSHSIQVPNSVQPLSFTTDVTDPVCAGGNGAIIIHASGGTGPYTYYIYQGSDPTTAAATSSSNFMFSRPAGEYWVAVQDAKGCVDINGEEKMSWWDDVEIVDTLEAIVLTVPDTIDVSCYGGNNGSVVVDVAPDAVYSVSIDGGATWKTTNATGGYTFTNLVAGTYTVKAKSALGCTAPDVTGVVVAQPTAPITFAFTIKDTSCGGLNDGEITVTAISGGVGPYDVSIKEGTSAAIVANDVTLPYTFAGLKPTYYSMTVTDANGCVANYSNPNGTGNVIAVQSPADLKFTVAVVNPACNGGNGTITVNATGGSGVYQFRLNTTTYADSNVFVVPAGTYTVYAKNAVAPDCEYTQANVVVTNPPVLVASITAAFAPTCKDGSDGYVNLSITGGTGPFKYSINNGPWSASVNGPTANVKVAATVGTHVINVVDAKGCTASVTGTIGQAATTITASSAGTINCNGDDSGHINVNITEWPAGRSPQYLYSSSASTVFTSGTGFVPGTGEESTSFYAGTYYVGVVDEYGCQSNVVAVTIAQNPALEILGVTANAATCYNTFNGNITITAQGGNTTSWLQYAIVNNPDVNLISNDRWVNFTNYDPITKISTVSFQATKGTYYVFVRDNGCDVVAWGQPVVVTGYDQLKVNENAITKTNILCYGESTGVINVPLSAVTGGAGSYMFTLHFWNDEAWEVVEDYDQAATGLFEMLPAGTYRVHVEDNEGCPSYTTANIVLSQPTSPVTFTMTKKNISCYGANDGLITVNVSGGTVTSTVGYSFTVNETGTWFPFGVGVTTKTYVATQPGIYTITVKDANGCIAESQTDTIWEPAPIAVEFTTTNETCALNDGTLTITDHMGGWAGKSTFEYKINASGTYTSSTTFTGLPAGNHTLYVKAVVAASDTLQAHGDCYITQPFTIVPFTPITYTVDITDVHCKGEADGTLTVTVTKGGTPSVLNGYEVRLTGDNFDQTWWTGPDHAITFDSLAHSHYTVYITDSVGCELKATVGDDVSPYETVESFEVNEPATLLTVSAERVKNVTCYNGADGSFTITAAGGVAPYKFYTAKSVLPAHVLVPDPTSNQWIPATGNTYTKTDATAGTWIVWVMDANGCVMGGEEYNGVPVNEWRVQILQPAQLQLTGIYSSLDAKCHAAANGEIWIDPAAITGGNGAPYSFTVTGTNFAGEAVSKTYTALATSGGYYKLTGLQASWKDGYTGAERAQDRYTVQVTDKNGCTSTTQVKAIKHPKVLDVTVAKAQGAFSCPDAVEGFIEATVTGGTPAYQYRLWKNGAVFTGWVAHSAFLVQIGNSYTIEVKDQNGCADIASIDIDPVLPAVITGIKDLTCFGATVPTVRLTATGDPGRTFEVSYQKRVGGVLVGSPSAWIPFSEADSHVISTGLTYGDVNDADGHYRFWIRDNAGCVSEYYDATFVPVQHALAMTHTVVEGECTSEVTFSVNGGIAPYELWIDGEMVEEGLEPNSPVTLTLDASEEAYSIVVRDAHECVTTAAELLIEANPVTDEVTVETYFGEETHYVNEAYEVDAMLNAAGSPYTFEFTTEEGCVRVLTVTVVEVYKEVAISEIQGTGAASPAVGMKRAIRGTVTGVVAGVGYFVQDKNEAWSGIWVADPATTVAIGNGVYVEGTVSEVDGVTTLTGTGTLLSAAPLTVTAIALTSPELAKDEKYESVLVQVKGVRAAAADANGRWEVFTTNDKRATVNKWLYTYAPVAGNFYDVTGIIDGRAANYYLNPRMASDIRDITATTDITVIDAVDFKVYPNPFNNELYIDNHNKLTRVSITNIAGQRVMDVQYPERVIRTANLVSGVYVISLFTEEGIVKSERIVKR